MYKAALIFSILSTGWFAAIFLAKPQEALAIYAITGIDYSSAAGASLVYVTQVLGALEAALAALAIYAFAKDDAELRRVTLRIMAFCAALAGGVIYVNKEPITKFSTNPNGILLALGHSAALTIFSLIGSATVPSGKKKAQ